MTDLWTKRFELIRGLGWIAVVGLLLGLIAVFSSEQVRFWTAIFAVLMCLPAFAYTYVVVIWHWKERYRGRHSDLWGALILIETTGWLKLVYLFRHLIPDMRHGGRYAENRNEIS
jgi:hypothetical protein